MMSAATSPHRVCIIDDEPGVRDLLELICVSNRLTATAYDCAEAFLADPEGGISDWDLIVLDVDLPGMSGLALLETLRQHGCSQPAVMISGAFDPAKVITARQLGAAAFFDKPFSVHAVSHRICELLGNDPTHAPAHLTP